MKIGRNRLVKLDDLPKLTKKVGEKIWWHRLHRIVNTIILLSAILSIASGKLQDENWLPNGEMNHFWYYVHLTGWLIMLLAFSTHLLMSAKVGGIRLILSMFKFRS